MVDEDRGAGAVTSPPALLLSCPVCGKANPGDRRYCDRCRAPLDRTEPVAAEEAMRLERRHDRRQALRRWQVPGVALVVVAILAGVLYVRCQPPDPLPPPSSAISSESPPGAWTTGGHDALNDFRMREAPRFTGAVAWTFATTEPFSSSPVSDGAVVYLGTGERRIVALDAATGRLLWEVPTTGPLDSTPAIAGDLLFVGLRDGRVLALNRVDGSVRWQYDTGSAVGAALLVAGGELYVSNGDGRLSVFDAANGRLRWRSESERSRGPVTRVGDVVITWSGSKYYLWDATTGTEIHEYTVGASITTPVAIQGHTAFVGDFAGGVWASDVDYRPEWYMKGPVRRFWGQLHVWGVAPRPPNGDLWATRLGRDIIAPFAVDERFLYIGTGGRVMALDTQTHQNAWSVQLRAPIASTVLAGSTLLVSAGDGLHALDAASGKEQWASIGKQVATVPAVTAGGIFVAAADGVLYALK